MGNTNQRNGHPNDEGFSQSSVDPDQSEELIDEFTNGEPEKELIDEFTNGEPEKELIDEFTNGEPEKELIDEFTNGEPEKELIDEFTNGEPEKELIDEFTNGEPEEELIDEFTNGKPEEELIDEFTNEEPKEKLVDEFAERDPVEELAAEFAERIRDGERVSVEEYASRHPALAEQIRDLFPTIVAMERLNTKRLIETSISSASAPEQLGDYRIIAEIARGGMGIVYEAEQVSLGRRVAVKVLPAHALSREHDIRRFEREAQTAANLHHSNIVPVFGVGEDKGQRYIVMQLIRGVGLDEILAEIKRVVVDGQTNDETSVTTSRTNSAKRSAADLLESELKLNSTSVEAHAETVEIAHGNAIASAQQISPLALRTPVGADYFKNVARIGLQAAEAIQYAHHHDTLHRDIKPGNLILDEDGRVWIADFGLAKAIQDDDVTCSGDIVGTMAYVAPERFQGKTTKSSDLYSLGVTLHEMLTLQKSFQGEDRVAVMSQVTNEGLPSPRKLNKAVPRDLETIVLKAAARDPNDRYASAGKLANDLQAFLEYRPIEARRLSYIEHGVRWCRRNRGIAALCATVMILLATVFGLLAFGYRHSEQQRLRAESTSKLAIGALDQIYNHFALTPLSTTSLGEEEGGAEFEPVNTPQMPISKDVASLLENLLDFYDELSTQMDDSDLVTVKFIEANRRVGDINRRLGQLDDARISYEAAADRISRLAPDLQETTTMRLETARVYNGIGLSFFQDWRHSRDRVNSHREAVAILDSADPTDEELFELATSLYLLHHAEQHRNFNRSREKKRRDQQEDEPRPSHLKRAQEILGQLKERKPDRAEYDLLLARCLLGNKSRQASADGESNRNQAIAILEGLIAQHPDNADFRFELGQVYQSIERLASWNRRGKERSEDQLAKAETRIRNGLKATADLEIQHPNIPKYYLLKKELHEFLARILQAQSRLKGAEDEYVRAMQMQRSLVSHDEYPGMHKPWLYRLELDYGKLLRDAGELERAKESLMATAHNLEKLAAKSKGRSGASRNRSRNRPSSSQRTLEATYFALANVLDKLGDEEASNEMMLKAEMLER